MGPAPLGIVLRLAALFAYPVMGSEDQRTAVSSPPLLHSERSGLVRLPALLAVGRHTGHTPRQLLPRTPLGARGESALARREAWTRPRPGWLTALAAHTSASSTAERAHPVRSPASRPAPHPSIGSREEAPRSWGSGRPSPHERVESAVSSTIAEQSYGPPRARVARGAPPVRRPGTPPSPAVSCWLGSRSCPREEPPRAKSLVGRRPAGAPGPRRVRVVGLSEELTGGPHIHEDRPRAHSPRGGTTGRSPRRHRSRGGSGAGRPGSLRLE